jgi:hypothetical protein
MLLKLSIIFFLKLLVLLSSAIATVATSLTVLGIEIASLD